MTKGMTKAERVRDAKEAIAEVKRLRTKYGKRKPTEKKASREEQHARYIDCGPQNWDDR